MIGYAFGTRKDGDVRKKKFDEIIFAQQVHGVNIAQVTKSDSGKIIPNVDGLVYKQKDDENVQLAVLFADCVPILAWDPEALIIGAAHAGWRGTLANISGNLITKMTSLGADPEHIQAVIGPHIGMCCYTVPEERAKKFLVTVKNEAKIANFIQQAWHLDLGWANFLELTYAGILPEHITTPVTCTSCQVDKYFSFRRTCLPAGRDTKETFGEQMGVLWIGKK